MAMRAAAGLRRWLRLALAAGLALLAGAALAAVGDGGPAPPPPDEDGLVRLAQSDDDAPLLLRLFGIRKEPGTDRPRGNGAPRTDRATGDPLPGVRASEEAPLFNGPAGVKAVRPKQAEVVITPKDPDARRVLVIGDSLGVTLGKGLTVAFADTPSVRIDAAAVAGSGIARNEPVDWRARLEADLAAPDAADAIVMMFGLEDRVPIAIDGADVPFGDPSWEEAYRARFRAVVMLARERQLPIFVVGLMPMADDALSAEIATLDGIYRDETATTFARYIDVWNEFADETGSMLASGPDVTGQVRQLRLKDGIGFTRSGSRKLAFYAEQEIRSWMERGLPAAPIPAHAADGLVISLSDPEAAADEDLADAATLAPPREGSPLYELVVLGLPLLPVPGRVDDATVE